MPFANPKAVAFGLANLLCIAIIVAEKTKQKKSFSADIVHTIFSVLIDPKHF